MCVSVWLCFDIPPNFFSNLFLRTTKLKKGKITIINFHKNWPSLFLFFFKFKFQKDPCIIPPVAGDHFLNFQIDLFFPPRWLKKWRIRRRKKKMLLSVQYVAKILHTSHLYPTTTTTTILERYYYVKTRKTEWNFWEGNLKFFGRGICASIPVHKILLPSDIFLSFCIRTTVQCIMQTHENKKKNKTKKNNFLEEKKSIPVLYKKKNY
jgi:hypothetical protein